MDSEIEKWPPEEAAKLRRIATRMFTEHYNHKRRDPENCGACALQDTGIRGTSDWRRAPNYAGWLRDYIQSGRPVSKTFYQQELAYAQKENQAYYQAILRDIATFGLRLTHTGE